MGGHNIRPVRDREAPGSNPGPPTNFVFKTGDFCRCQEPTGHSRGTDSLETPANEGVSRRYPSADLNSGDSDLVAVTSCISVDATGRTVRHPVRKSQAGPA